MDATEFLRKLIDALAHIQQPADTVQPNHAQLTVVAQPQSDFPEDEHTSDETGGVMVPPLQQKIELLKKVAGVDSMYDDSAEEQPDDELAIIKRNAGIHPIVAHIASDEEIES